MTEENDETAPRARADRAAIRKWIGNRTQTEAAAILGTAQSTLAGFVTGNRNISLATMARWADRSGIPLEVFTRSRLDPAA